MICTLNTYAVIYKYDVIELMVIEASLEAVIEEVLARNLLVIKSL